tara:strand:+ start:1437 stop:3209 length:1773 start_codon:yes stop_codon:yes gene_type:complete
MYYSKGNYEAFARAKKPINVDEKSAYLIGSGLASLSAAAFLIRDGQMKGNKIHVIEELALPGGSMDGIWNEQKGYIIRGGREMEPHFETLWDLFRSIPSLDTEGASVLDEFYWLNKVDPSFSRTRVILNKGERLSTDGKLTLTPKAIQELIKLILIPEEKLEDLQIDQIFTEEFFKSNFWLYWATMFAFEPWASALEMRRYVLRFISHVGKIADMSSLRFTKYNQYESLILPLVSYLKENDVHFLYNTQVQNIVVDTKNNKKIAHSIELIQGGEEKQIHLTENDLVFVTNGSITESSTYGDNNTSAPVNNDIGGSWKLWKRLAQQDVSFGKPEKFCENIPNANWVISGTITLTDDKVIPYIEKIIKKNLKSGTMVTSGPVTIKDSHWLYGFSISRQPHFKDQKENEVIVWVYGLFSDKLGNYVKKKITDCSGIELCEEWLYHIGIPESEIPSIAQNSAITIPCRMTYITSYFMPRALGDRPLVVPNGSVNLAFIGNFAETEKDTVFTTEYSVRTAMEAVYTLLQIDRGVPEVFASSFDIRVLLEAIYFLNDKKKLKELELPWLLSLVEKYGLKKIEGTYAEELLKNAKLL